MIRTIKRKIQEWFEDFTHKLKTGESTIRRSDGYKVYINQFGGTRVNPSEILRLKKVREELEFLSQLDKNS